VATGKGKFRDGQGFLRVKRTGGFPKNARKAILPRGIEDCRLRMVDGGLKALLCHEIMISAVEKKGNWVYFYPCQG
jgi:hypothetical protein